MDHLDMALAALTSRRRLIAAAGAGGAAALAAPLVAQERRAPRLSRRRQRTAGIERLPRQGPDDPPAHPRRRCSKRRWRRSRAASSRPTTASSCAGIRPTSRPRSTSPATACASAARCGGRCRSSLAELLRDAARRARRGQPMFGQFARAVPARACRARNGATARWAMRCGRACGCATCSISPASRRARSRCASAGSTSRRRRRAAISRSRSRIDHARDGEVMLAFAMNGEQLPLLNGFPLRLVVPGWYSTYWIKALDRIEVLAAPDDRLLDGQGVQASRPRRAPTSRRARRISRPCRSTA